MRRRLFPRRSRAETDPMTRPKRQGTASSRTDTIVRAIVEAHAPSMIAAFRADPAGHVRLDHLTFTDETTAPDTFDFSWVEPLLFSGTSEGQSLIGPTSAAGRQIAITVRNNDGLEVYVVAGAFADADSVRAELVELTRPSDDAGADLATSGLSVRRIALTVGLVYYIASFIIFRGVVTAIPSVLRGEALIVGDELVPFFNPSSQLLEQAKGEFNQLTHGYEFRVRYSFLTTWLRYYKVLPFAILLVLPTVFWAVYLTTARFIDRVFTSLSSSSVYLATGFPTALIYLIMVYAKVTHFYTLIIGLAMMTMSSLWLLQAILFEKKWKRWALGSSLVALLNPAIHYLILFILFFAMTIFTLTMGEFARWLRKGGPGRARHLPGNLLRFVTKRARRRKVRYLARKWTNSTMGRIFWTGLIFLFVTVVPYAMFVKFIALRGVDNLSETVPGDYYFIRDASVSWAHILSWDLAGITDKLLFGDYLAKVPRYPNVAYTLLLLVPLVVPFVRRRLFVSRPHRQLLGVVYFSVAFAFWATIGYAEPVWFPTFHRAMAGFTRAMYATDSAAGDLTLTITSTVVQVLRFPHRFQLILFMIAPMLMSLTLAFGIDTLSGRLANRERRTVNRRTGRKTLGARSQIWIQLTATVWIASVFFTPFWANQPYRTVYGNGTFGHFAAPYPVADLKELKAALLELPEGKTVVLPPTETAKLVTDSNGIDHKFIDKFYIYYLDVPSYYYGLTGDTNNKFEFFLMLRGMYYEQDWWVNIARDIDLRYLVVNKTLRDNRGIGAEYLPNVEDYIREGIDRRAEDYSLRFENDSFALYELIDRPNAERETLVIDSSWPSYLDLVFSRLDLSRCYNFEYLPYYSRSAVDEGVTTHLLTDNVNAAAIDLYLLENEELIFKPSTKIFAFNPDIVASSYYLSPMFRSFLFFSNTKWNRTEIITPGVFGSLRGSFIGVPRPTRFDVPITITEPGRYRMLMRSASTANQLTVRSSSLQFEESTEVRSPTTDLELFTVDSVYETNRIPFDASRLSVEELESMIGDELVPVNRSFSYHDLGVVDAIAGVHNFAIDKADGNPMLFEGLMLIPEDDFAELALPDDVSVITDPNELDCSERTPVRSNPDEYVAAVENDVHPDLTNEELVTLAAAGVEDLIPKQGGGLSSNWYSLGTTALLLFLSGLVIRWRSQPREEDDDA